MFASFLAALFFALNGTCANRNLTANGPVRANLGRLIVATLVLGAFAHTAGHGFSSASVGWFFLSGVIGMGMGDLGLYAALPLLGSRLTILVTQCLAAPLAALGEWLWLGTRLTAVQITWGLTILAGVALAITPSKANPPRVKVRPLGFLFAFGAACGQGFGALVSRKGVTVAETAGEVANNATFGITAAYQRILAGLVFTALWFLALHLLRRLPRGAGGTPERSLFWLIANGFSGPILGVGCYQWALATTPSGLVLPIVATTPLLAIPITYFLEGDRPSRRSIVGGIIAVGGAVALATVR
jgi:drug/metabolite transporter (DMT)-like permease